ncbi:MAG: S49 family peptidase [Rhodobacteraceae bacterium]|nr:S49 family peptidase [Paracoccaceae bacterium]
MKRFVPFMKSDPLVSVVRLSGVIAGAGRGGVLNDSATAPMIERAFRRGRPVAVAMVINSPGGSPAQSSLIAARIKRLSAENKVPVHAFVEDVAASGGYWLACAANRIWIDAHSILGSIGVISASFGLQDFIARFGIERRVHTAGKDKSMLDPFCPERPEDVERLHSIQRQIHDSFIAHVKASRGERLADDEDLFTGDFWVGEKAVSLGLADGLGHVNPKMKELYGEKTRFAVYGPKRNIWQRFGVRAVDEVAAALDARTIWARYGL